MRALKKVDGLLGLTLANNFVSSNKEEQTLDKFLEHVRHAIEIMSVDNVCFGFDFMDYLDDFPNSNLEEVNNATLAFRIIDGLEKIGLTREEIDKICFYNFYNRYQDKLYIK
jgi:membrane dipeptidase